MGRIPGKDRRADQPARDEFWKGVDNHEQRLLTARDAALVWRVVGLLLAYVALISAGVLLLT